MSAPKLNIHSKSLFLVHQGDSLLKQIDDKFVPASVFLKRLLISRQFLRSSQIYKVYHWIFNDFCEETKKFDTNFSLYHWGGNSAETLHLTLEEIEKLNQILNLQYIDVYYKYSYKDEFSALCRIFKDRIALNVTFDESGNEIHHHEIIEQIRSQLFSLRCNVKVLVGPVEIPHLDLLYISLSRIENFYQLKQVLTKHRTRKVAIANLHRRSHPKFDETVSDDYFIDFPVCPRIRKFNVILDQLDENHEVILKLTEMVRFFPNLMETEWLFGAEHNATDQTAKQMIKHFLKATKLNELKFFQHRTAQTTVEGVAQSRSHYYTVIEWKEPKLDIGLTIEGDLDPSTLGDNEVIEEDDHLLIHSKSV